MLVLIKFDCGYCGCDEYRVVSTSCETIEQFEDSERTYLDDTLENYASENEYLAEEDYENECDGEEDDEEREDFLQMFRDDCYYLLSEITFDEAISHGYIRSFKDIEEL